MPYVPIRLLRFVGLGLLINCRGSNTMAQAWPALEVEVGEQRSAAQRRGPIYPNAVRTSSGHSSRNPTVTSLPRCRSPDVFKLSRSFSLNRSSCTTTADSFATNGDVLGKACLGGKATVVVHENMFLFRNGAPGLPSVSLPNS